MFFLYDYYKFMDKNNFKVLAEDKLLTVTSDDGAGDLHCDTDSNSILCTHMYTPGSPSDSSEHSTPAAPVWAGSPG